MKDKINGIIFSILKDLSEDLENEKFKKPYDANKNLWSRR